MVKKVILSGAIWSVLLFGALECQAEKWDKNDYTDATIKTGYYAADSIKTKGKSVTWTEKYLLTNEGAAFVNGQISKHDACKASMVKKGNVTQYQLDYEVKNDKFRGVAKRYYNKADKLICTDKETGNDFKSDWGKVQRGAPIQQAQYDLVTRYKVKFE